MGRTIGATFMVAVLLSGIAMLAAARWAQPVADADRALARGEWDRALAAYTDAQARFDRQAALKQLFSAEYDRIVGNQLWLLYRLRRYDDLIDRAQRAPDGADPHFWSGLAFYVKGSAEEKPEGRLSWFGRAEEELRRAVEAGPADWDTKYDFELTTRLAAELRKQPKTPPNQLMQLLRPQPKLGSKPARRVG